MQNWMKIGIAVLCVGILAGGFFGIRYLSAIRSYKNICSELQINNVDLTGVKNGIYAGAFDAAGIVCAKVEVTVRDHKITEIKLVEHKNERGQAAGSMPSRVLDAQTLEVDVVSGATNSSKVILKAIENALESGRAE